MLLKTSILIILLIITFASGFWLNKIGRPLNNLIFSFHKIFAIAAIILSIIIFYNLHKTIQFENTLLIWLSLTGVLILLSLVSGALLSFDKFAIKFTIWAHGISSVFGVIFMLYTFYLYKNMIL
jgi:hypothetical protein